MEGEEVPGSPVPPVFSAAAGNPVQGLDGGAMSEIGQGETDILTQTEDLLNFGGENGDHVETESGKRAGGNGDMSNISEGSALTNGTSQDGKKTQVTSPLTSGTGASTSSCSSVSGSRTQFSLELERGPVTHPSRAELLEQSPILGQARKMVANKSEETLLKESESLLEQTAALISQETQSPSAAATNMKQYSDADKASSKIDEGGLKSAGVDETLIFGSSGSGLLAETAMLVSDAPIGDAEETRERASTNGSPSLLPTTSCSKNVKNDGGVENESLDVQAELARLVTCSVADLLLVCCGQKVNLQDMFLLDTCAWLPLREDISNNKILSVCSEALALHGYDVRSNEEAQLRASLRPQQVEAPPAPSHQAQQQQNVSNTNPFAASQRDSGSETGHISDKTLAWAQEKSEVSKAMFSNAMNFSLGKLGSAIGKVNSQFDINLPQPGARSDVGPISESESSDAALFSERALREQNYCGIAVGVDAISKQRVLAISGLEHFSQEILERLVLCGITSRLNSQVEAVLLDEDYVRDIQSAFKLSTEIDLVRAVAPAEQAQRKQEWQAAQLIALVKVCYKQYGVPFPMLERPPVVSQLPLEYDDDEEDGGGQSSLSASQCRDAIEFKQSLAKRWAREFRARKKRKEKQLELRCVICKRNRGIAVQRLHDSDVARGSKEVLLLSNEMRLSPQVVLGFVSAIFQRKPGRLSVTGTHLLFFSNVLGIKSSASWSLSDVVQVGTTELKGAASFVGDASFVARLDPNSLAGQQAMGGNNGAAQVSFIISTVLEVEKLMELVNQVVLMRREQLQLAGEDKEGQQDAAQHPDLQTATDEPILSKEEQEALAEQQAQQDEATRIANMKKMLSSTILHDDEEEF